MAIILADKEVLIMEMIDSSFEEFAYELAGLPEKYGKKKILYTFMPEPNKIVIIFEE